MRDFLTDEEYRKTIQNDKAELIRNGILGDYHRARKEAWSEGYEPSEDPKDYGLTEYEKDLCDRLLNSKKKKKNDARQHVWFLHEHYDNVGFLTLSFSDRKIEGMTYEWMKKVVTSVLASCFDDYIGRAELSPKGRIHFHFIVAWNGTVSTLDLNREGKTNKLVLNKHDLQEKWYGETTPNGQPSKYGIYDLILIPRDTERTDSNKIANYVMKSLYTMESYISKQDEITFDGKIDEDLLYRVNASNVITPRGTPYQLWKADRTEQDRFIKKRARVFDATFYDAHKYDRKQYFRDWAEQNKGVLITPIGADGKPLYLIPTDYKTIDAEDYMKKRLE